MAAENRRLSFPKVRRSFDIVSTSRCVRTIWGPTLNLSPPSFPSITTVRVSQQRRVTASILPQGAIQVSFGKITTRESLLSCPAPVYNPRRVLLHLARVLLLLYNSLGQSLLYKFYIPVIRRNEYSTGSKGRQVLNSQQ